MRYRWLPLRCPCGRWLSGVDSATGGTTSPGDSSGSRRIELRTANERDLVIQRPLHHEVVSAGHTQRDAHGAVAPFDFAINVRVANYLGLDVRALVREIHQDDVAELKPLDVDVHRHRRECKGYRVCLRASSPASP